MSVRLRRLYAEHERLKVLFAGHERIHIAEAFGDPPDRYIVEYKVKGLTEDKEGVHESFLHRVQITLGPNYPNEMPACMVVGSPVFHPNIDHLAVCTADVSSASRTLDQTIVFIGELITFQAYNLQSPRNGEAKKWTEANRDRLPLERVELLPRKLLEGAPLPVPRPAETPAERKCANCGRSATEIEIGKCSSNHFACADCTVSCSNCGRRLCLTCDLHSCHHCKSLVCADCGITCPRCNRHACVQHALQCAVCAAIECESCCARCSGCGRNICPEHLDTTGRCPKCVAGNASVATVAAVGRQN